jgi:hypothetical protein
LEAAPFDAMGASLRRSFRLRFSRHGWTGKKDAV